MISGQSDIKKLRRENEQLRREIWSLRDEYDKLEDILKKQKTRGESEEYEVSSFIFSCMMQIIYNKVNTKHNKGTERENQYSKKLSFVPIPFLKMITYR